MGLCWEGFNPMQAHPMPPPEPWELPPPDQVQYVMDNLPALERLARLAYAERRAEERGDSEVLAAIAMWRLRQQLKG
jgi:hypothetical protein